MGVPVRVISSIALTVASSLSGIIRYTSWMTKCAPTLSEFLTLQDIAVGSAWVLLLSCWGWVWNRGAYSRLCLGFIMSLSCTQAIIISNSWDLVPSSNWVVCSWWRVFIRGVSTFSWGISDNMWQAWTLSLLKAQLRFFHDIHTWVVQTSKWNASGNISTRPAFPLCDFSWSLCPERQLVIGEAKVLMRVEENRAKDDRTPARRVIDDLLAVDADAKDIWIFKISSPLQQ